MGRHVRYLVIGERHLERVLLETPIGDRGHLQQMVQDARGDGRSALEQTLLATLHDFAWTRLPEAHDSLPYMDNKFMTTDELADMIHECIDNEDFRAAQVLCLIADDCFECYGVVVSSC